MLCLAVLVALLALAPASLADSPYTRSPVPRVEITRSETSVGGHFWLKLRLRCVAPEADFVCKGRATVYVPLAFKLSLALTELRPYRLGAGREHAIALRILKPFRSNIQRKGERPRNGKAVATVSLDGLHAIRRRILLRWKPAHG
jgi:hypothetical protein